MNLHHLTDRHLRRARVDALQLELDESFADPPERAARLRARASVIRIGRAELDYGRAYDQYMTAAPGTPAEDQAERRALAALDAMARGAAMAVKLGDTFKVGRPVLDALEPRSRAVRTGQHWASICPSFLSFYFSSFVCPSH